MTEMDVRIYDDGEPEPPDTLWERLARAEEEIGPVDNPLVEEPFIVVDNQRKDLK